MPVKWKDFKLYCLFHPFTLDQLCWWNVIADLPSCVRTFWRRTRCPPLCLQSICCLPCWRYGMIPSPMYVWHWPESWLSALFLSVSGALQILKQMEFSLRSYGVILEKRGLCATLHWVPCKAVRGDRLVSPGEGAPPTCWDLTSSAHSVTCLSKLSTNWCTPTNLYIDPQACKEEQGGKQTTCSWMLFSPSFQQPFKVKVQGF